jgi:hypothetical protein
VLFVQFGCRRRRISRLFTACCEVYLAQESGYSVVEGGMGLLFGLLLSPWVSFALALGAAWIALCLSDQK